MNTALASNIVDLVLIPEVKVRTESTVPPHDLPTTTHDLPTTSPRPHRDLHTISTLSHRDLITMTHDLIAISSQS